MIARAIDRQAWTMCRYFDLDNQDQLKVCNKKRVLTQKIEVVEEYIQKLQLTAPRAHLFLGFGKMLRKMKDDERAIQSLRYSSEHSP